FFDLLGGLYPHTGRIRAVTLGEVRVVQAVGGGGEHAGFLGEGHLVLPVGDELGERDGGGLVLGVLAHADGVDVHVRGRIGDGRAHGDVLIDVVGLLLELLQRVGAAGQPGGV